MVTVSRFSPFRGIIHSGFYGCQGVGCRKTEVIVAMDTQIHLLWNSVSHFFDEVLHPEGFHRAHRVTDKSALGSAMKGVRKDFTEKWDFGARRVLCRQVDQKSLFVGIPYNIPHQSLHTLFIQAKL